MATIRINRGKWQAIVRRVGFSQQSKTFLTKTDARRWAYEREAELNVGVAYLNPKVLRQYTVADILLKYRKIVTIKKKGHLSEGKRIDGFLNQPWSSLNLDQATPAVFSRYRDQRLSQVKPATVRRDLGLLGSIFQTAQKEWDIPITTNPIANVKKPSEPPARNRRLKPGELDALLKASASCGGQRLSVAIQLALETGMRRGELLSAQWEDISFERNTLLLRDTKNGRPRCIPLSEVAVDLLLSFKPESSEDSHYILPVSSNALQLSWQRCKKNVASDLPDIVNLRFHDLRHEAISRFFEIGLSIPEVALISGHRDPRMLFNYIHLRAEDIASKLSKQLHCR